jgi:hypothetical protein
MKRTLVLLFLSLFLLQPTLAQGYDASGVWVSNSGNVFTIPYSEKYFDLIITTTDGRRMIGKGEWVQKGQSFTYTVSGVAGSAYVSYNAEADALEVTGPNGTSWWRRSQ